jgi:uncharacterized protein
MMQKIPLFMLNAVLFPGGQLMLHVFEERYRLMISRCLEQERPFGIVLIKEGVEVGGFAVPYTVGTLAQVSSVTRVKEGRMYIIARGLQRFRIQYVNRSQPYPVGSVMLLAEESGEPPHELAQQVSQLYARYRHSIAAATGSSGELEDLPEEPLAMSYVLADRVRVPLPHKQRWLEADVATRLREISAAIQYELRMLPEQGPESDEHNGSGSWN